MNLTLNGSDGSIISHVFHDLLTFVSIEIIMKMTRLRRAPMTLMIAQE